MMFGLRLKSIFNFLFAIWINKQVIYGDKKEIINPRLFESDPVVCGTRNSFTYKLCAIHFIIRREIKLHIESNAFIMPCFYNAIQSMVLQLV